MGRWCARSEGVLDSEGGMCALCSFLSMYFFKSGPVAAGMGTEGDEGSPVLRVAEETVSAGRERSRADSGGTPLGGDEEQWCDFLEDGRQSVR